jgi:hypothetical protein
LVSSPCARPCEQIYLYLPTYLRDITLTWVFECVLWRQGRRKCELATLHGSQCLPSTVGYLWMRTPRRMSDVDRSISKPAQFSMMTVFQLRCVNAFKAARSIPAVQTREPILSRILFKVCFLARGNSYRRNIEQKSPCLLDFFLDRVIHFLSLDEFRLSALLLPSHSVQPCQRPCFIMQIIPPSVSLLQCALSLI